jgi:probable HAF family extracellular repeat protein
VVKVNRIRVFLVLGALSVALCSILLTTNTLPSYAQSQEAATYDVTDLGDLGFQLSYPFGINESGAVAGYSSLSGGIPNAFLSMGGSPMQNLGTLTADGRGYSYGFGINDLGQVVGQSWAGPDAMDDIQLRAFLYENGAMKDLGSLGTWCAGTGECYSTSSAEGINNASQVVGSTYTDEHYTTEYADRIPTEFVDQPVTHAFLYENGAMKDLGSLGSGTADSQAYAINESGQVVGSSRPVTYEGGGPEYHQERAFLYENGAMKDLGSLGGDSEAHDINNSGEVVGYSASGDNDPWTGEPGAEPPIHAFLYENGAMKDLGSLGNEAGLASSAESINDLGQVVGRSGLLGNSTQHAFLYEDGTMKDLNTLVPSDLGLTVMWAFDINEEGQIVATGHSPELGTHALLLTPKGCQAPTAPAAMTATATGSCAAEVKIGTQDNIEPAIDTSRFASKLEVKSVEGLGCSIDGTNGPACKFEWLRTPTQEKSDVNFQPSTDSVTPDNQYNLANNGQNDEWHKFKVRVTNPQTNATV